MLTPSPKQRFQITDILSPRSPLTFLGYAALYFILGRFTQGDWIGLILVPVFALIWWLWDRWRNQKLVIATEYSIVKKPPKPASGLILLLSPYNPKSRTLKEQATLEPLIKNIVETEQPQMADFEAVGLPDFNLVPQIKAVEYHLNSGTLRDIWLITSKSYKEVKGSAVNAVLPLDGQESPAGSEEIEVKGSEEVAVLLKKYLQMRYGTETISIHITNAKEDLTIKSHDYAGLARLGEKIFRQASFKDREIVADITGGNKMMSVAIAMACIPPGRRMQYMDSDRDWNGKPFPKGEVRLVEIDIDPILYQPNAQV